MGKGDRRSRKGKIWRGSFGKYRPKPSEDAYVPEEGDKNTEDKKTEKAKPAKKKKAKTKAKKS